MNMTILSARKAIKLRICTIIAVRKSIVFHGKEMKDDPPLDGEKVTGVVFLTQATSCCSRLRLRKVFGQ
jgi:hypothetical protein